MSIRPVATLSLILLGLTAWLTPRGAAGRHARGPGASRRTPCVLLGLLTLAEALFHRSLDADDLLFPSRLGAAAVDGRMAVTTAIALVLLGISRRAGDGRGGARDASRRGRPSSPAPSPP